VVVRSDGVPMDNTEKQIKDAAMRRIVEIFNISLDTLRPEQRFGEDLKNSAVLYLKLFGLKLRRDSEFDFLSKDINDVADRKIKKEITSGSLIIRTVEDYCCFMVRCYKTNPKLVKRVLRIK